MWWQCTDQCRSAGENQTEAGQGGDTHPQLAQAREKMPSLGWLLRSADYGKLWKPLLLSLTVFKANCSLTLLTTHPPVLPQPTPFHPVLTKSYRLLPLSRTAPHTTFLTRKIQPKLKLERMARRRTLITAFSIWAQPQRDQRSLLDREAFPSTVAKDLRCSVKPFQIPCPTSRPTASSSPSPRRPSNNFHMQVSA